MGNGGIINARRVDASGVREARKTRAIDDERFPMRASGGTRGRGNRVVTRFLVSQVRLSEELSR